MHQAVPISRKRQLVNDADHAIVVILDFSFEALSAIELKRIERLDHRRSLVAHIRRGRVFHPRLRHGARTHRMLQMVEAQLFTYVELDQDQNKSTQTRRARTRNCSRHLTPASYCILSVTAPGSQLLISSHTSNWIRTRTNPLRRGVPELGIAVDILLPHPTAFYPSPHQDPNC